MFLMLLAGFLSINKLNRQFFPNFDVETISWPFISKSPPSWGVVSAATDVKPPAELIRLSTVILLNTDASASLTNNSSLPESIPADAIEVCPVIKEFSVAVSYTHLTLPTKRIV